MGNLFDRQQIAPGKSCGVSCLSSTPPPPTTDTLKLIVIDCDKFHLLSCLATQQEGELFLDNNELYNLLLGGLGVL